MKRAFLLTRAVALAALCLLLGGCPTAQDVILSLPNVIGSPCLLAVDAAGNRYIAGVFASREILNDFNPTADKFVIESPRHLFVTRYNADGTYAWTQSFGENRLQPFTTPLPRAIVAGNGRVYIAGSASGENRFRKDESVRFNSRLGSRDAFIFALDAATGDPVADFNGNGVVRFGGAGADEASALALSPDGGTLFVGGAVRGTAGVSLELPGGGTYVPPPTSIGFVMALDSATAVARPFGVDTNGDGARDGVLTVAGEVAAFLAHGSRLYVLGDFAPFNAYDASVLALHAATGEIDTTFNGGRVTFSSATGRAYGRGLALSEDGLFLYVTGAFDAVNAFLSSVGPFAATLDGLDYDDFDAFVFCVNAQTGQPRSGFGADVTGDLVGDGVAVFDRAFFGSSRLNFGIPRHIVCHGDSSATGALLVTTNEPSYVRGGVNFASGDSRVIRLTADTGAIEPSFGAGGIVEFGRNSGTFIYASALTGNLLLVAGIEDREDATTALLAECVAGTRGFLHTVDITDGADLSQPVIRSLDPPVVSPGGPEFTLTVRCLGIAGNSEVLWNGDPRPTTFVDARTLRATIFAADIATPGSLGRVAIRTPDGDTIDSNDVVSDEMFLEILSAGFGAELTHLVPLSRPAGGGAFRLLVEGSGFDPGARVRWNGGAPSSSFADAFRPTTVVSSTRVEAEIPAEDVAEPGTATVEVYNPGTNSNRLSFVIGAPLIDSLEPASARAGTPGLQLIVSGSRFAADVVLLWNGEPRTILSRVGSSHLLVAIPASDLETPGQAIVTARNPGSGADVMRHTFTIATPTGPVIRRLEPASKLSGSGDFTLTVRGTNFNEGDLVCWDGAARPTTFVSATQLEAQIPGTDLAEVQAGITVAHGEARVSNELPFPTRAPNVFGINPSSAPARGPKFTMVIDASLVAADAVAMVNGERRETQFIPARSNSFPNLLVTIPASDIAQDGTAEITVHNPGTGTSNVRILTIGSGAPNDAPIFTEMAPSSFNHDGAGYQLVIIGQNLAPAAELLWNGAALPRDPNQPTTFVFQIPAALVDAAGAAEGTAQLRMRNPDGQVSNPLTFVINAPVLEQLNPSSAPLGSGNFQITLTGRRFSVRAQALLNSLPLETTYVSDTQLTATIPAEFLGDTATVSISVQNPSDPSTSDPLPFHIGGPMDQVQPQRSGGTVYLNDRDHDGWIDDLEQFLGSSPASAASTPRGFSAPIRVTAVEPLAPRLKTRRASRERLVLSGVLPLAHDFALRGATVHVHAGGKLRAFRLNRYGASPRGRREIFRVSARGAPGSAPFVLRLEGRHLEGRDVFLHLGETLYYLR